MHKKDLRLLAGEEAEGPVLLIDYGENFCLLVRKKFLHLHDLPVSQAGDIEIGKGGDRPSSPARHCPQAAMGFKNDPVVLEQLIVEVVLAKRSADCLADE